MPTRNLQLVEPESDRASGEHSLTDGANVVPILNDKNAFTANEQEFFEDTSYLDKYDAAIDLQQYVQGENKADGIRNFTRDGRKEALQTQKGLRAVALEGLTAEELKLINATIDSREKGKTIGKIASKVRDAITGLKLPGIAKLRAAGLGLLLGVGAIGATVGYDKCGNHGSGGSGPTSAITSKGANDKDAGTDAQAKDASADVSDAGDATTPDAGEIIDINTTDAGVATSASSVASVASSAPSAGPSAAKSTSPASKTAAKAVPAAKFGTADKSHSSASTAPTLAKSVSAPAKVASAVSRGASSRNVGSSRPGPKPESTGKLPEKLSTNAPSPTYYKFRYNNQPRAAQKNAGSVAQATEHSKTGAAFYDFSKNASRIASPKVASTRPAELDRPGVPPKANPVTVQGAYAEAFAKIQREKIYAYVDGKIASVPANLRAKVQSALKEAKINETLQGRVVDPNEPAQAVIRSHARATHEKLALNTTAPSNSGVHEPGQPSRAMMARVRDAINIPAGYSVDQAQGQAQIQKDPSVKAQVTAVSEVPAKNSVVANSEVSAKTPTLHKRHKLSGDTPATSVSATPSTPTSNSFGSREGNFTTVDSEADTSRKTVSGSTIENGKSQTAKAPTAEKVSNYVEKDPYANLKSQTEQKIRSGSWFGQESITVTAADGTRFTATVKKSGGSDQYTIFWREAK